MAFLFYNKNNRVKAAEKILGQKITKSVPNITLTDSAKLLLRGNPHVLTLDNPEALEKEYSENPVLSSVINKRAEFASNAVISVRNIKTGEIFTDKQFKQSKGLDKIVQKMFVLKNNPNPLQSTKEFQALSTIFKDVFGNGYIYAFSGGEVNIRDVKYLVHVWPQFMQPLVTGRYFDQSSIEGIIKEWKWKKNTYERIFKVNEILHRKEPNVKLSKDSDFILGESRQVSLAWALANIKIAYESRNVIARERGMRAIISSGDKDGFAGAMPMDDDEKREVQADLKTNYGTLDGQDQFMVTRHNISVHNVDQDVRKLGLLNEISSDAMVVCNRYGVPYNLLKMDLKGTTYENQNSDERRVYQDVTIPEETDKWEDINNWLKCRDFGYEYVVSFDHLPVLQENFKEKSEINKNISTTFHQLFFAGAVTYNDWLLALGLPKINEAWANQRITQMSMEQIQKIKANFSVNDSLDKQNDNGQNTANN